jgi:hypothetical protein
MDAWKKMFFIGDGRKTTYAAGVIERNIFNRNIEEEYIYG